MQADSLLQQPSDAVAISRARRPPQHGTDPRVVVVLSHNFRADESGHEAVDEASVFNSSRDRPTREPASRALPAPSNPTVQEQVWSDGGRRLELKSRP